MDKLQPKILFFTTNGGIKYEGVDHCYLEFDIGFRNVILTIMSVPIPSNCINIRPIKWWKR